MLIVLVAAVTLLPPPQQSSPVVASPADCLRIVEDFRAKKQKAAPRPITSEVLRKIDTEKSAMARNCAAAFDIKDVPAGELPNLIQLYGEAGQTDLARNAIDHGLATLKGSARAGLVPIAIRTILRTEPKSAERNARLEQLVDELDASSEGTFDQKFSAHTAMNGYYRADDIDAGILKHSNWIMASARAMTPEQRQRYAYQLSSAYRNAAEALAGQGKNDEALGLLRTGRGELASAPNAIRSLDEALERYTLVGTAAGPGQAPKMR